MTTTTSDNISNSSKRVYTTRFWIASFFAVILLAAPMLAPSQANAASTFVRVGARVLPWLNVTATPLISSYRVDAEAIQRGFIDLPNSLSIQLSTNVRSDIALSLESFGPERIVVGNGTTSGSDMIRIASIANNTPITRTVDLRVILPQGVAQGDYSLQLNLSAMNI